MTKSEYEKLSLIGADSLEFPPIESIQSVRMVAIDNLVTRDQRQWGPSIIKSALDSAMGLSGRPFILDHDWWDVDDIQGIIYDAKMLKLKAAPPQIKNTVFQQANDEIIAAEGYCPLVVSVAFFGYNTMLSGQALGALKSVSFGGNAVEIDLECPHDGLLFSDPKCRYLPPSPWYDYDPEYLDKHGYSVADYATYVGSIWFAELSQVLIPNLPGAQVISREIADFYK